LALAALAAGCGKAGPPVPPEDRVPQPVADLRAIVQEGAVQLTWTNPRRRADNTRLGDLRVARVYRAEDVGAGEPRPALLARRQIRGYREIATIALASAAPTEPDGPAPGGAGVVVRVADRQDIVWGRRYTYVVVTEDGQGHVSPPSERVSVTLLAPPEPPTGLTAVAGEHEVRLTWSPPERFVDGAAVAEPLAYEVLRGPAPGEPAEVVTPAPIETTAMLDRGLESGRTYHYAVRAVRRQAGSLARGQPSARVAATPRDMTPPSPPGDLVATRAADGVRLAWRPSPEPDVARYVVYRAIGDGPFERAGATEAPRTSFIDRDAPRDALRYAVTAVDGAGPPNESARSREVRVR
jgi:hypothetical protein